MDVQTLTQERFAKQADRIAKQQGHGSTEAGLAIVGKYFSDTLVYVGELKKPEELEVLSPEIITLLCLQIGISSVAQEDTMNQTLFALGRAAEREVYAQKLRDKADGSKEIKKSVERISTAIMKRHGGLKQRKAAFNAAAQRAGLGAKDWSNETCAKVGAWLLDICLATPVFLHMTEPHDYITLTEEATEVAHIVVERLLEQRPNMLPLLERPEPWTASTAIISGYKHVLVRKHDKHVQAEIKKAIKNGSMAPVLEAINAIQDTGFKVNHFVLEMIQWAFDNHVAIDGFPRKFDLPMPEKAKDWEDMSEAEQRVWKKTASDTLKANRAAFADRLMLEHDLKVAKYIGYKPFWVPCNMDYRGRVYSIGNFNFQRQDHIRALFIFEEGKPLDDDGLYWLKVHLANCGDFGKVSKAPFDERVKWVDNNWGRIAEMATDPKYDLWWTEADSPFLFLAACTALLVHHIDPTIPCRIPVSFDGSCSGLQHLAAMTRDPETAKLVNLTPTDKPGDVYATVAVLTKKQIEADLGGEKDNLSKICLAYGISRTLVKRNVMTYSYSSGRFGMKQQHMEDTMEPLAFKVLRGDLERHPFAVDGEYVPGYFASKYLADHVYSAIENTVKLPAKAMHYLQTLARTTAHEGKPLIWTTPLGLPVVLRCPVFEETRLSLWLHDKGVKLRYRARAQEEKKGIDKNKAASAVAPCFVHSMDAAHLQMAVRQSNSQGITSVALVHDSFGCLPTDAARFRHLIKDTFRQLYCEHDVLADIQRETVERMETTGDKVPAFTQYGTYDPNSIMEAEYAFA